jgi:hypothetical protein
MQKTLSNGKQPFDRCEIVEKRGHGLWQLANLVFQPKKERERERARERGRERASEREKEREREGREIIEVHANGDRMKAGGWKQF